MVEKGKIIWSVDIKCNLKCDDKHMTEDVQVVLNDKCYLKRGFNLVKINVL